MAHLTAEFPTVLSYGCRRRPLYRTTVIAAASGATERNQHWQYPMHVYSLPLRNRQQSELDTLVAYWHAAAGRANTFEFLDPFEDRSCAQSAAPAQDDQALGTATASQTDFQLIKSYTAGGQTRTRKITRPIDSTVLVEVDSVLQTVTTDYTIEAGGIIRFTSGMLGGEVVKAGFRFRVPVAFADDELDVLVHNYSGGYIADANVDLLEVRE